MQGKFILNKKRGIVIEKRGKTQAKATNFEVMSKVLSSLCVSVSKRCISPLILSPKFYFSLGVFAERFTQTRRAEFGLRVDPPQRVGPNLGSPLLLVLRQSCFGLTHFSYK